MPRQSHCRLLPVLARRNVPDKLLLLSVAKACAALGDVRNIKELHNEVIRFGFHSDVSLGNAMVDMMPRQGLEAFREMGLNGDWSETQCSNSFFNPTCLLGVERFEFGKSDSWVCGQTWNGR
ncbi:hypothetical protein DVH24_026327 [Malus domestica]|uniref:Pentatricopeptide repeat-containing protein n=1 Tax=Malus domestica TaxID=3750 RepID=A0A498KJ41_MALDO|nr:hypothetical protein DVH24_026327 [Malus domestica]